MNSEGDTTVAEESKPKSEDSDQKGDLEKEEKAKGNNQEQEEEKPNLKIRSRDDAQAVLEWQYNRYHHLQSLSRGLFGTLIAMLAILVSVSVTFGDQLDTLPPEMGPQYVSAASGLPVGPTGAFLTVALNSVLLYTLFFIFLYSITISTLRFYGVFTEDALSPLALLQEKKGQKEDYQESLKTIIQQNQNHLERVYANFSEGAFRILIFTSLVISSGFIYYYSTQLQLVNLLYYDFFFLLPGTVTMKFWQRVFGSKEDEEEDDEETVSLTGEFLQEDKGRWAHVELHRIENWLFSVTTFIAFSVGLIWATAMFI